MSIKNKALKLITVFFAVLILISCSGFKRPAIGPDNKVLVLADQVMWDIYKPQLERIFSDAIWTPAEEQRFYLRRIDMDEFNEGSSKFRYLILLANVDRKSAESGFIKKFFSDKIEEGVRTGDYYYAVKEDIWANGQNVLFLLDSDSLHLGRYLDMFSDKLFSVFNGPMMKKVKDRLFDRYNNRKAQDYTKKKYGIDIFIPHDFIVVNEKEGDDTFIRYRRYNPDRWLTVIRSRYDEALTLQENVINTRDRVGAGFGDSVKVNPEILNFETDTLFASDGIKAEGIWEYSEGGGPFFTHAFNSGGYFWLIDGAVFAPSKDKYPFIIQLELMARTVSVSGE